MSYLVLDLETSGDKTNRRFCNPLNPLNEITLAGWKHRGKGYEYLYEQEGLNVDQLVDALNLDDVSIIVGHNVKFDLLWLWGSKKLQDWLKHGGRVWDTLTIQYLLDGQRRLGRSLDDLAVRYGGSLKDSDMKAFYKEGGKSKDYDRDKLIDYNREDINNTNLVLQGQLKSVKNYSLLKHHMEHYLATIEMEYNGMMVDQDLLKSRYYELKSSSERYNVRLISIADSQGFPNFNPGSNDELSVFLFGGVTKEKKKLPQFNEDGTPIIVKKTGLQKEKFGIVEIEHQGLIVPKGLEKNKKGLYKVDKKVLESLYQNKQTTVDIFLETLLSYRQMNKKLSTYYEGFLECRSDYTKCVHGEFKTSNTVTGRLSSTNPNVQNLHPEITDCIISRYGKKGHIVEIDASQLEIRIQAYITECSRMIEDIENDIDFHTLRLSYAEGLSYEETLERVQNSHEWALKRKAAKTVSFQKAYGASIGKIAEETELSEDVVKAIFNAEDLRYPEVREFYEDMLHNVQQQRFITKDLVNIKDKITGASFTKPGEQQAYGVYTSITGKDYVFSEYAVLTKSGSIFRYFKQPQIQNYPIQGTAADYIACQIGRLYRWLLNSSYRCKMINEVHDSIILDCHEDDLTNVISCATFILEDTEEFEKLTNRKFAIPMKVDVKVGSSWGEIKRGD